MYSLPKFSLDTNSKPVIDSHRLTLNLKDLGPYQVAGATVIKRTEVNGGAYFTIVFKHQETGETFSLPAVMSCGLGTMESFAYIVIELRARVNQQNRLNWTPWIIKFVPEGIDGE